MKDRNGLEIHTGDIVKVTGAYFKRDNGTFLVTGSEEDPYWLGRGHTLIRITRNGNLSTAKDRLACWPLLVRINSLGVWCEVSRWNEEHATIEVQPTLPNMEGAKKYSRDIISDAESVCDWEEQQGFDTAKRRAIIAGYRKVLNRIEAGVQS